MPLDSADVDAPLLPLSADADDPDFDEAADEVSEAFDVLPDVLPPQAESPNISRTLSSRVVILFVIYHLSFNLG